MARKRQSAARASHTVNIPNELIQRMDAIHARRLALEAEIQAIETRFLALTQEREALNDAQTVHQTRRKLRYPTP
jgi:hypothetical protein